MSRSREVAREKSGIQQELTAHSKVPSSSRLNRRTVTRRDQFEKTGVQELARTSAARSQDKRVIPKDKNSAAR